MAIIKCKECGGDLVLVVGQSVAECEFCGRRQTVPAADDEKKLIQFERAERLRKQCEFDKASGIYETIVAEFRQESEAYWGLVLCKYGIEYVDDPVTGKKIPTCHRSSFDSIMDDSDLEQALENADPAARKVYRDEAKQIEEIRKGIVAVSNNEQPYDIFICYKETDINGERTLDSVLAQDIYEALTDKGYRVFFSRITLEDKLGVEYEPYIFAALNSAKIMLAFGTDYEYFNAVWVKNEWSRYLKLMAQDKGKYLIPCYKGIDAYDMPKEFAKLQAQDLGKVGATQDLLRGIEKILPKQKVTPIIQEKVVVGGSGNNKVAALLDRGNLALEDGDWNKADSFFEDVLNNDSRNAQAYLGKTLAMEKCRTIDAFARKRKDYHQNAQTQTLSLQPAIAHIDQMVKECACTGYVDGIEIRRLYDFDLSYSSKVGSRKQQYQEEQQFWLQHKQLSKAEQFAVGAVAENLATEKKALFAALSDRVKKAEAAEADAKAKVQQAYDAHIAQADKKAEQLYQEGLNRRETNYQALLQVAKSEIDVKKLQDTASKFDALGSYQDSKNLAEHCRKRAEEEQAKINAEKERLRIIEEKQKKARKAKLKIIAIISTTAITLVVAMMVFITQFIIPSNRYKEAESLLANGQFEDAIVAFGALEGFKNSEDMILECQYVRATVWLENGQYAEAIQAFQLLGNYKNSKEMINACHTAVLDEQFDAAVALMHAGDYEAAITAFSQLQGYRESEEMIDACRTAIKDEQYESAIALMNEGKYKEAISVFQSLSDYRDSKDMIVQCNTAILDEAYQYAVKLMSYGNYSGAIREFEKLDGYKDSSALIAACNTALMDAQYTSAINLMNSGEYKQAVAAFQRLNNYKDSAQKIKTCQESWYNQACEMLNAGQYDAARTEFLSMGNYSDCKEKAMEAWYQKAENLLANGDDVSAAMTFGEILDYRDAWERSSLLWEKIVDRTTICAGNGNSCAVKKDGTVVTTSTSSIGWSDIIAIDNYGFWYVALKKDGTVVADGLAYDGADNISKWKGIVSVKGQEKYILGLKSNGTVVATGESGEITSVRSWKNIIAIEAGYNFVFGLTSDGKVVVAAINSYQSLTDEFRAVSQAVGKWTDIVAISVAKHYSGHVVGLKKDGTVVVFDDNCLGHCDVSEWKNVIAISAGEYHIVALKSDGTVIATGYNAHDECDVSAWRNIVAISAGKNHTIALKSDGTVVAVGGDGLGYDECAVSNWRNIRLP